MKKKICFIIIFTLITLPLISLAVDDTNIIDSLNLNIDDLISGGQTTAPNITVNKFDLIWSADTYTPFDYIGRALPTRGSQVTVDAVVKISNGDAKSLKYSWFLEDIFQQNKSGYGKTSFSFYVQQFPGMYHTVRLQIFNEDRTVFEEKSIKIPVTQPELIIYSTKGNTYFSNQASNTSNVISGQKFSFVAKPYFFSINKLTDLIFEWTVAGQEPIISSDYNASILDLNVVDKNTSEISEQSLQINVKNPQAEEQNTYKSINLNIQ